MNMDDLITERKALTDEMATCEPGAHPGSPAWMRESAAMRALAAFDAAHPEVHAEIMRRHSATFGRIDVRGI